MRPEARNRLQLAVIAVLLLVIVAMAWKFIVAGTVQQGEDGRQALLLEPAERAFILQEMRDFVAGLQQMTEALAREDMAGVAAAARGMGSAMSHQAPVALVAKLPLGFKTLGFGVHRDFDALAADAEDLGDPGHALEQLSQALRKCVACHEIYQISAPSGRQSGREG
ncbi:MAG TPA: hypothetical protein PKC23_07170 [Candidatus Desulfobacillus sp.]|nr:hypothetical protein [Candidatus Desulfobacillus sp.]